MKLTNHYTNRKNPLTEHIRYKAGVASVRLQTMQTLKGSKRKTSFELQTAVADWPKQKKKELYEHSTAQQRKHRSRECAVLRCQHFLTRRRRSVPNYEPTTRVSQYRGWANICLSCIFYPVHISKTIVFDKSKLYSVGFVWCTELWKSVCCMFEQTKTWKYDCICVYIIFLL